MIDLDALEAAAKAATQGEWTTDDSESRGAIPGNEWEVMAHGIVPDGCCVASRLTEPDAAYIVAAQPRAILALIEEVRRLREAKQRLEDAIRTGTAYIAAKRPNDAAAHMTRALGRPA